MTKPEIKEPKISIIPCEPLVLKEEDTRALRNLHNDMDSPPREGIRYD